MANEIQDFYVTHFERDTPPKEGYVKLPYMTATEEGLKRKIYFMGFGQHRPFNEEYLQAKLKSGSLIKLPAPHKITRDKALWMDSEGTVYIADKKDPFIDTNMLSVYKSHPKYITPMPDQIKQVFENQTSYIKEYTDTIKTSVNVSAIYNNAFKKTQDNNVEQGNKEKLSITSFATIEE